MELEITIKEKVDKQTTYVLGSLKVRIDTEFYNKIEELHYLDRAVMGELISILKKRGWELIAKESEEYKATLNCNDKEAK